MAINVHIIWELRRTNGSDNNGGGFREDGAGTDFSQQDAAQATLTTASVVHTTTTQININAGDYTVSAADVGNILQITGGTATAGFYEIISVDVGNNRWTLDRSAGTAGQTVAGAMGGALGTLSKAYGAAVTGNTIWAKNTATYTLTSAVATTSSVNGIHLFGYGTTRGDGTKITITTATNSTNLISFTTDFNSFRFRNINFSNTASTRAECFNLPSSVDVWGCSIQDCTFTGFTTFFLLGGNNQFKGNTFLDVEITAFTGASALNIPASATKGDNFFGGCNIHDNAGDGILVSAIGFGGTFFACIFDTNGGDGADIKLDDAAYSGNASYRTRFINCTFYANTAHGINWNNNASGDSPDTIEIYNNIFYLNGGYGINALSSNGARIPVGRNNAFGANVSGARNNWTAGQSTDITLTGNPFNDAPNRDFSLNNTAGAGLACRDAGWPTSVI